MVKQTLDYLVELQGIDDDLRHLREAKSSLEKVEHENQESLAIFDKMLAAVSERIQETRNFIREKEDEIRDAETNIGRSRQRMGAIQSQKELTALNKELEIARRSVQTRTEELTKLSEQLKSAEADHQRRTDERNALEREMSTIEKNLKDEIAVARTKVDGLTGRRKAIQASLPRELFSKYERISKGRNGQAVIALTSETCNGCNMQVPPQVFIRLIRGETLEQCANCNRLLVYKPGAEATDSLSE